MRPVSISSIDARMNVHNTNQRLCSAMLHEHTLKPE